MYNTASSYTQQRLNQYLVKEIMEASPQQLLIKIYDFAILNCQRRNIIKTNNAIQELINSLNFQDESAREIATGLLRLYQFCQDHMRKNEYELVYKVLTELRDTWRKAFNM
ncbi:MAG: flagellar protein FliS [Ignavibacteriae bacterium HGW-Ignavibacteriae-2]|jgi:flagellar protein FliS|nr:flagellar protein FliS [Bacteroidota bacterium]PKL87437.1 MAG: flagellar protein FliS [Ignavibacteriae bacterium HGW-Ignavibacteriae-2]